MIVYGTCLIQQAYALILESVNTLPHTPNVVNLRKIENLQNFLSVAEVSLLLSFWRECTDSRIGATDRIS